MLDRPRTDEMSDQRRAPTAQPVLASEKTTPKRFSAVPLVCSTQVSPPVRVATIVPFAPTAQAVFASTAATALSEFFVPLDWELQVKPLSVVTKIVPSTPTAHPTCGSPNAMKERPASVTPGSSVQLAPPSLVRPIQLGRATGHGGAARTDQEWRTLRMSVPKRCFTSRVVLESHRPKTPRHGHWRSKRRDSG
jgi:hypothetical protein